MTGLDLRFIVSEQERRNCLNLLLDSDVQPFLSPEGIVTLPLQREEMAIEGLTRFLQRRTGCLGDLSPAELISCAVFKHAPRQLSEEQRAFFNMSWNARREHVRKYLHDWASTTGEPRLTQPERESVACV